MKKIFLVLFLIVVPLVIFGSPDSWDYVYHNGQDACLSTDLSKITVNYLIQAGCRVYDKKRNGMVLILDCRNHPEIKSYVWFAKDLASCKWIRNQ